MTIYIAVIKIYQKSSSGTNKKIAKENFKVYYPEFEDNNFFGKARITFQHNTIYEYISSMLACGLFNFSLLSDEC